MTPELKVLLAGEFSGEIVQSISRISGIQVVRENNYTPSPESLPEILVLEFDGSYQTTLHKLSGIPIESRPILLAVIPSENSQMLRQAMQAGARDYLIQPVDVDSLETMVKTYLLESQTKQLSVTGKVTAIISANNNAEAAFITGNLAQITVEVGKRSTAIIDLDLQFSSLPLMLDIEPERSLLDALEASDTLDEIAIDAYLEKHKSGLKIIGSKVEEIALPGEVSVEKVRRIIDITSQASQNVFVNLPHSIDPLNSQIMEDADQIIICVDQSFSGLNYCKGLLNILFNELDISSRKITLLVNHFQKKSSISQQDIEKTLSVKSSMILAADNNRINGAERFSLLLHDTANQSPAYRQLLLLAEQLSGAHFATTKGLISRIMARIESKSP